MWDQLNDWVSNNRGTAVGAALLVAAVLWGLLFGEGSPIRNPDAAQAPEPQGVELRRILDEAKATPPPVQETPEEEANRLVTEYAKKAFDEPENPDAPAMLLAAGNLHLERLNNPAEAAGFYSQVVYNYPNWEGTPGVYPQLAKALELSGDQVERQRVLQSMIQVFPPESAEHQYAQAELGRQ